VNAAQTYKQIIFRWKTYIWSFLLAFVFFGASLLRGWYVERHAIEEELLAEEEENIEEEAVYDPSAVPFEADFRRCAPSIGWDWEMLASVAYHESRFNPNTVSPGGAQGLMQLMPVTGMKFGLTDSTFFNPADNIAAGCKYIARLQHFFEDIADTTEQTKFVLASYNAGPSHIYDAQALARKYGADPQKWDDVEYYLSLLKYEEYYTDSVVRYGSFGGRQTIAYVRGTLRTYQEIRTGEFRLKKRSQLAADDADSLQFSLESEEASEAELSEATFGESSDSASFPVSSSPAFLPAEMPAQHTGENHSAAANTHSSHHPDTLPHH